MISIFSIKMKVLVRRCKYLGAVIHAHSPFAIILTSCFSGSPSISYKTQIARKYHQGRSSVGKNHDPIPDNYTRAQLNNYKNKPRRLMSAPHVRLEICWGYRNNSCFWSFGCWLWGHQEKNLTGVLFSIDFLEKNSQKIRGYHEIFRFCNFNFLV